MPCGCVCVCVCGCVLAWVWVCVCGTLRYWLRNTIKTTECKKLLGRRKLWCHPGPTVGVLFLPVQTLLNTNRSTTPHRYYRYIHKNTLGPMSFICLKLACCGTALGAALPDWFPAQLGNPDLVGESGPIWQHCLGVSSLRNGHLIKAWACVLVCVRKYTRLRVGRSVSRFPVERETFLFGGRLAAIDPSDLSKKTWKK